jgi:hypothetical protein
MKALLLPVLVHKTSEEDTDLAVEYIRTLQKFFDEARITKELYKKQLKPLGVFINEMIAAGSKRRLHGPSGDKVPAEETKEKQNEDE